jgi:group II intron reverse transcriptase/maturase
MSKLIESMARALAARRAQPKAPLMIAPPSSETSDLSVEPPADRHPVVINHTAPSVAVKPSGGEKLVRLASQIYSLANLMRAWKKVKANSGGPGIDGESLQDFETNLQKNLKQLQSALQAGTYQPQQVRRVWVPKPSGGARPLAILTIRDRIVQRSVYDVLAPFYERKFLDSSYGFREGRSLHDAARRVAQWRDDGRRWVVDGDIKDCFERIEHRLLLDMIRRDVNDWLALKLIDGWLKARVFNEWGGRDLTTGTYQGGVISPLLANIYLHAFDQAMSESKLALVRYADDWVILCAKKVEAEAALDVAAQALERLRLVINPYKTRVVNFDQGFKFLGVFFVRNEQFDLSPSARPNVLLR